MCTASNFIVEGRMRPHGRRLWTVGLYYVHTTCLNIGIATNTNVYTGSINAAWLVKYVGWWWCQ